ncbi:hypothetical protein BH10ACT11_BH10ACT11_01940 [soil metagenome]
MSTATLVLAHIGHLINAVPFVAPCFLLVGGLIVMRLMEGHRDDEGDSFGEQ